MKKRLFYFLGVIAVISLGLASRKISGLSGFIYDYAGDILWAMNLYFVLKFVFPEMKVYLAAIAAYTLSVLVEVSQLYHTPWIDSFRGTLLGGLILGFGFLWSDVICYAIGILLGAVMDVIYIKVKRKENEKQR